ncbi:PQQ-dependent sugar dehydrogenase [Haloferula sargassicola]|uniref:Cytochrome c domain-containing protein n=1 Tax=Haloferula sargassicola TaxID=490096 RepID=A0ABP9ULA2_9BACT
MKRLLPIAALTLAASAEDAPDYSKMKADQLFETLCSSCHGKDLNSGLGGSLVDGQWKHGATDAEIRKSISEGNLQLGMTPFKTVLNDDQIRMLVIYIREKEKDALAKGIEYPKPEPGKITHTDHEDYKIEMVVEDGLDIPWAIGFLPDGRKLVTERPGRLRVIGTDGKLDPEPIQGTPAVIHHGQGGLMEVAIHPDYEHNGWIYLGFADGWRTEDDKPRTITKYVRGRIKDHQWVDEEEIWKADKEFYTDQGVHFGTRLVFDQGYIYFVIGERYGWKQAQDVKRPNGKIYRLFEDGRVPDDNPFVDTEGAIPGIWTYGHRNPQGLALDPRDGSLWETEHGPRGGDELNVIERGKNYGWPIITYGMNYDGTPITGETEKEGMEQPVIYWQPSIAACGLDFYTGDQFPEWKNDLFAGALAQQEVRRLRIVDHQVTEQEIVLKNIGRVRDVASGPDGYLYIILNDPHRVIRLVPAK